MDFENTSFVMAERLKELRQARGLSHIKLSEELRKRYNIKISKDALIAYEAPRFHARERANEGMSTRYLRSLADFYGVSAGYLLGIEDLPEPDANIRELQRQTGLDADTIDSLKNRFTVESTKFSHDAPMTPTKFINELIMEPYTLQAAMNISYALNEWLFSNYYDEEEDGAIPDISNCFHVLPAKEYSDFLRAKGTEYIQMALRLIWLKECREKGVYADLLPSQRTVK